MSTPIETSCGPTRAAAVPVHHQSFLRSLLDGIERELRDVKTSAEVAAFAQLAVHGLLLDLKEDAPKPFAHEGELIALVGKVLGEVLEFGGAFEARRPATFHRESSLHQFI